MSASGDTIAAVATPPGAGGIGVVRISGSAAAAIAEGLAGRCPSPRQAALRRFRGGQGDTIDRGLVLYFPAPHSFTGEDVIELHGHGGPVVMELILRRVVALGARRARPGEFSERAFLNDKLDLAQAEAVADLIAAGTEQAARAANRSLEGAFSEAVTEVRDTLIEARVHVEAAIDFADEDIDFLADSALAARLDDLDRRLDAVLAQARRGRVLRDGLTLVLAGRPNAGKSSLLNRLAGRETAIVTEIAGTTRDVLHESVQLDGIPLHLIDTAGLRLTEDPVEREGVRRAREALAAADAVLLIVDATAETADATGGVDLPAGVPVVRLRNKIDLSGEAPGARAGHDEIALSARTGAGMEALSTRLTQLAGGGPGEGSFTARARHLEALERAKGHVTVARDHLHGSAAGELAAEELRCAQQALDEITGQFSSDDLLGEIFATFCIGK